MIQLMLLAALLLFFGLYLYAERDIRKLEKKYKICFDERAEAIEAGKALRNHIAENESVLKLIWRQFGCEHNMTIDSKVNCVLAATKQVRGELYRYEALAVAEAPKLGMIAKASAWELMQWIVAEAHQVQGRLRTALHDYDVKLAQLLEVESVNDVLRKQSECYLLSRNQARGDIEGVKRQAISFGIGYDQYNAIFSVIGAEIPSGPPIEHPGKPADIIPSPKRRPRKARNGS